MHAARETVSLTTDGSGAATGYTNNVTGRILGVHYVKPGSGGFDNGVSLTVTLEATGESVVVITSNTSLNTYPRVGVQDATGAAATLDGTRLMRTEVVACNDRVKVVVAGGGSAKTGTVYVIVG